MRVLLIEDDRPLSDSVARLLKRERIETEAVFTGPDGLEHMLYGTCDAVILDVMLPDMDGFEVLKRARKAGCSTPVLMLTARGGLEDRVGGLNAGADYYLAKPFEKAELTAALKAVTRRADGGTSPELSCGGAELSEKDGSLVCASTGKSVKLSSKEYQLAELFMRNKGRILSKDMITERVWGFDSEAAYNNPEVYVSFLRKKLSFIGAKAAITTRRGMGYCMEEKQ